MESAGTSLQNRAYEEIRDRIIYAVFRPGAKLLIKDLCNDLDMGRTPIRESLVRLGQQGLVYSIPQSGTYVSRISLTSAENGRFMREQLERQVCVEASARIEQADLDELETIVQEQVDAVAEDDQRRIFEADNRFHEKIFDVAGRHQVWTWLYNDTIDLLRFRWIRLQVRDLRWERIIEQHCRIYEALRTHTPEEAGYLAAAHLHLMLDEQRIVISEFPDYFTTA